METDMDFELDIDTSDMDVCMGCGEPLDSDATTFEEVLGNNDGRVYLPDGGSMDVPAFKDLRARALTVASVLEERDSITAEQLFLPHEWAAIGEKYGHLMTRGLSFLADLRLIPFFEFESGLPDDISFVFHGGRKG